MDAAVAAVLRGLRGLLGTHEPEDAPSADSDSGSGVGDGDGESNGNGHCHQPRPLLPAAFRRLSAAAARLEAGLAAALSEEDYGRAALLQVSLGGQAGGGHCPSRAVNDDRIVN